MPTTASETMTTKEIAKELKKHCEKGDFEGAHRELYAKNAVSIEPMASGGFEKETHGLEAIFKKGQKWNEMVSESHSIEVSDPMIAGESFALAMTMDTTMKDGKRNKMTELCVYHVKDGKIVSEQFFM
jgi:ketosteroid isomerase-like protein